MTRANIVKKKTPATTEEKKVFWRSQPSKKLINFFGLQIQRRRMELDTALIFFVRDDTDIGGPSSGG